MATALTRKQILDALGGYQKTDALSIDMQAFSDYLAGESDRGTVVALGSIVEDMLAEAIFARFVRSDAAFRKDLLRSGSLLASWNDKTKLALALGIIDETDAEEIEVLAAMRNACAHSRQQIDFSTPVLRDALTLLFRGPVAAEGLRKIEKKMFLRTAFVIAVTHVIGRIRGETDDEAAERVAGILEMLSDPERPASLKTLKSRLKKIGRRLRTMRER